MSSAGARAEEVIDELPPDVRNAFLQHLHGGTSANYLAKWLKEWGTPVSATTLKVYRRKERAS